MDGTETRSISFRCLLITIAILSVLDTEATCSVRAKFERTKPHVDLIMLGHTGHGKTALLSAITKLLSMKDMAQYVPFESINNPPTEQERGIKINKTHVEYETEKRHYAHADCPKHSDYIKNMIIGTVKADAAVLVVEADDGPTPQTMEHIVLARQTGIRHIVVFLNNENQVPNEKLVELEVRELLNKHGYPKDQTPIIRGRASKALESDNWQSDEAKCIFELLAAIDHFIPNPVQDYNRQFLMPIEDVVNIAKLGVVATGRVERGIISAGDKIEIVGIRQTMKTMGMKILMFRKLFDQGHPGDNIGILLQGIKIKDVERGQVIAAPGSVAPHTEFEARIYVLAKDEDGKPTPFFTGYRPNFYFRTIDVPGVITLPESVEMVRPGDNVLITVKMATPIAIEKGLHFAIRGGGRTVGAGIVLDHTR